MEYQTLRKEEGWGECSYGIEIRVATEVKIDLKKINIYGAAHNAMDRLKSEICAEIKTKTKKYNREIENNKNLLTLFKEPIFAEEIPNGYCSDWCCRHLPWFIVTTSVGRFLIGWRKRVIHIDWSETVGTGSGYDIFKDEESTKGDKYIHVWSENSARDYIKRIIDSAGA